VKPRTVLFADIARGQLRAAKTWWIDNDRPLETLVDEIEQAIRFLAWMPGAGTLYPQAGITGLRRLYLRRTSSHLYYTFTQDAVMIRAFWHARRGCGPFRQG
jgi:plasmid stabilization system protein ParE